MHIHVHEDIWMLGEDIMVNKDEEFLVSFMSNMSQEGVLSGQSCYDGQMNYADEMREGFNHVEDVMSKCDTTYSDEKKPKMHQELLDKIIQKKWENDEKRQQDNISKKGVIGFVKRVDEKIQSTKIASFINDVYLTIVIVPPVIFFALVYALSLRMPDDFGLRFIKNEKIKKCMWCLSGKVGEFIVLTPIVIGYYLSLLDKVVTYVVLIALLLLSGYLCMKGFCFIFI